MLLHGGLMTISEMTPLIHVLAVARQVTAVELQGHGRTADTDRPLRPSILADDIGVLIEALGFEKADLAGYSLEVHPMRQSALAAPSSLLSSGADNEKPHAAEAKGQRISWPKNRGRKATASGFAVVLRSGPLPMAAEKIQSLRTAKRF